MCINSDNNHGFAISGKYPQGIALIDCENLTSTAQLAAASRWMGFGRVELFGRAALLAPWRVALTGLGVSVAAETLIADDAPTQAADQAKCDTTSADTDKHGTQYEYKLDPEHCHDKPPR